MSAVKNFKISISYPPLESPKGTPFLSQNRQFQWTNTNNVIYPVVPAQAATLLSQNGYQVFWDDAIAQNLTYQQWLSRIINQKPDLIALETKTPVIKKHWRIIDTIKNRLPKATIILMGDHVTALPQESLKHSKVDYVLTGGDYDFMLLSLANHLTKKQKLEPGFYTSKSNTGKFTLHHNLDQLPLIDRQLTQWHLYSRHNTNYKYRPGAYIMSARDCWWGKCTFCSWTTLYPSFRTFSVNHTLQEINHLVSLGVKEVFDDAGTIPVGPWLNDFCHQLIKLNQKIKISCNLRFSALNQKQYQLLSQAGFRLLLYGLESANQNTIAKLKKNIQVRSIKNELSWAKKAGLEPHLTVMIGYPWESLSDATNTLNFSRQLFKDGLVNSLQATIVIPYPGTPLFDHCQKNKLLLSQDWDDYDMRQPVIKSPLSHLQQQALINSLFKSAWQPKFLLRQVLSIRSFDDLRHLATYAVKFLQKLRDFS
jgi:radical SAM superfamily enzyme YgiQ (UPF0313 family)